MVHEFYSEVRADPCLGPIFERRLHTHWPEHLERMRDFWSSVRPAHFERWLYLFKGVLQRIFVASAAADIYARAERMSEVLKPVAIKPVFA